MYQNHTKSKPARSHKCVNLSCQIEGCTFKSSHFSSFCEHLKLHIRDGEKIACQKLFSVRFSFTSHISRKHAKDSVACRDGGMDNDNAGMHDDAVVMENDDMTETVEFGDCMGDVEKDRDVFLNNLALFYLRMQAKMLLPASAISTLMCERSSRKYAQMLCHSCLLDFAKN